MLLRDVRHLQAQLRRRGVVRQSVRGLSGIQRVLRTHDLQYAVASQLRASRAVWYQPAGADQELERHRERADEDRVQDVDRDEDADQVLAAQHEQAVERLLSSLYV